MKKEYPDILKLEGEKWHNPDPATGKLGTRVPAEWLQTTEDSLKSLTLEMLEVLKAAGINPNELNNTQVRDAIQGIVLEKAGAPSTITASTKNSVTQSSHTHEIAKATTSQQGIVQLANNIDDSEDKAATPKAVNGAITDKSFGVGQKWQDVTTDRAFGVEYYNHTSKPISIHVETEYAVSTSNLLTGFVDDVTADNFDLESSAKSVSVVNFIVPPGSTYKVIASPSNKKKLKLWTELR